MRKDGRRREGGKEGDKTGSENKVVKGLINLPTRQMKGRGRGEEGERVYHPFL